MKTLFQFPILGVVRRVRYIPENFFKILERPTEANGAIGLNYACQQQLRSQKSVLANIGNFLRQQHYRKPAVSGKSFSPHWTRSRVSLVLVSPGGFSSILTDSFRAD